MANTIRFARLVETHGKPYVVTLWTDPQKNKDFIRAVRQNRVLTVRQENVGSKKDVGAIGFYRDGTVSYLVFPKPLPENDRARVVGIKYDLLETSEVRDAAGKTKKMKRAIKRAEREFSVVIKRTATWEESVTVKASDRRAAERKAADITRKFPFDLSEAILKNEVESLVES